MTTPDTDIGTPMSTIIRERIKASKKRFNANDNIAEFIRTRRAGQAARRSGRENARACCKAW